MKIIIALAVLLSSVSSMAAQPNLLCGIDVDNNELADVSHSEYRLERIPGGRYRMINTYWDDHYTTLAKDGDNQWKSIYSNTPATLYLNSNGSYELFTWISGNFEGYLNCEEIE